MMIKRNLHEAAFKVLDVLFDVASKADTTPARAAIAWVMGRPGVVSPIIGARTMAQLEDNLAALTVQLTAEQRAALDQVSTPALNFPYDMARAAATQSFGGLTINGQSFVAHNWAKTDEKSLILVSVQRAANS